MQVKCGIDIIEIDRIKNSINNLGDKFINKVFTEKEVEYCESKNKQRYQHYAARFAAKEATFKAISESLKDKYMISWKDIEIINDANGKPYINIDKIEDKIDFSNIENIDLSISHCRQYASANVVVLYK